MLGFSLLLAAVGNAPFSTVLVGLASFFGGIMLILSHRKGLEEASAEASTARHQRFEVRKYRRRSLVGSLIASMGVMLAALYWVTDGRAYSAFLLMILALLAGILLIAVVDCFSVGLHSLTDTRAHDHEALLNEYKQRKRESESRPLGPDGNSE